MASQDWFNKDFYKTLGVPKTATSDDIKKAYRKLARKMHPDANAGDASAEAKFKEVGEAYAVLSDKEQRQQYDSVRAMGGGARFAGGPSGGAQDAFSGMFGGGGRGGAAGGAGFEDLLSQMFNGGGGGAGFNMGPQPGADLSAATEVGFREAAQGATIKLKVGGRNVSTRLPVGVRDGQKIKLRGKGQPSPNGGPAGDLVLTVHVAKHAVFTVDGADLRVKVPVTFQEAALGATVEVPTLDGERVKVKVPSGTNSGKTLRVKGRGLETKARRGDLLATVDIHVPVKLSKDAKAALESFTEATDDDPRASWLADSSK